MNKLRFPISIAIIIFAILGMIPTGRAAAAQSPRNPPQEFTLPSAMASGNVYRDAVWVNYYRAAGSTLGRAPGVVVIPPLGTDERDPLMRRLARYLASEGFNCAVMDLPAHGRRRLNDEVPANIYAGGDIHETVQALRQGASDVGTVAAWLRKQPEVDPEKIGVVGISLGAIVTHLAMGLDPTLKTGVAILGGGNLEDLYHHSIVGIAQRYKHRDLPRPNDFEIAGLSAADPLTYANKNQPRHVLMIEAARDIFIPPQDSEGLWRALGKPPIQWVDTNHFGCLIFPESCFRAASTYLKDIWSNPPVEPLNIPKVYAPTIKAGLLYGMGMGITPAIQWQFHSFASRPDHMSLLNANLGMGLHGPFAGLALTVNQFVDIGMGSRLHRYDPKPYISVHIVF